MLQGFNFEQVIRQAGVFLHQLQAILQFIGHRLVAPSVIFSAPPMVSTDFSAENCRPVQLLMLFSGGVTTTVRWKITHASILGVTGYCVLKNDKHRSGCLKVIEET